MARIRWTEKALDDLERIDQWREERLDLPPVGPALVTLIDRYFTQVDLSLYLPGTPVQVQGELISLHMLLLRLKRTDPYRLFYRPIRQENLAEIRRIRHPRQGPLT